MAPTNNEGEVLDVNELGLVSSLEEYQKRVQEWDRKFNLLVSKGGMSQSQYAVSRHYYGLGVFTDSYSTRNSPNTPAQ